MRGPYELWLQINLKGVKILILINKEEAMAIREALPDVAIRRTMRQKTRRHRYYVEATKQTYDVIKPFRGKDYTLAEHLK